MADSDDTTGEMSDGLQVELFHPDSDREPGDTNYQGYGFDIHPVVFPVALVIIALFVAVTVLLGDQASAVYRPSSAGSTPTSAGFTLPSSPCSSWSWATSR